MTTCSRGLQSETLIWSDYLVSLCVCQARGPLSPQSDCVRSNIASGTITLAGASAWAINFVRWYNFEHRHSGIRYVSPAQRHAGEDHAILAARHALYTQARERNPARWSGETRNWSPVGAVTLNPERDSVVKTLSEHIDNQQLAT